MPTFQCIKCGKPLHTELKPGDTVVCEGCSFSQRVPPDFLVISRLEGIRREPPAYWSMLICSALFRIAGWLSIVFGIGCIVLGFTRTSGWAAANGMGLVVSSLFCFGFGQLFESVRDLARESIIRRSLER